MDFEKLLDRIKEMTVKLEDENTGIEESFKLFEETTPILKTYFGKDFFIEISKYPSLSNLFFN